MLSTAVMDERIKYQIFLPFLGGPREGIVGEWTNLAKKIELPDGRVVKTKLLVNGGLQYARRNGVVGVAPASAEYKAGQPAPMQWRVNPACLLSTFAVTRAPQPPKRAPQAVPAGIEFEPAAE